VPRISVIVPNYNYARYLDERLGSILAQTYADFELIILDDASTDGSREVIARYAGDPRVRTRFFETNSGSVYARWNDGAAMASGEFLLFAGADDSCDPRLLEKLLAPLVADARIGLSFCRTWFIDADGARLHLDPAIDFPDSRWASDFVADAGFWLPLLIPQNVIPNASAVLIRREMFEAAGRFRADLRLTSDWVLWIRIASLARVAYVAEALNHFRTHAGTVREAMRTTANWHRPGELFAALEAVRKSPAFEGEVATRYADFVVDLILSAMFRPHRWRPAYLREIAEAAAGMPLMRSLARGLRKRIDRRITRLAGLLETA
jgi:glycosyltransferase involved in cell wall biosynthesis